MNKPDMKIDILEMMNQTIDAKVNNDMIAAAEKVEKDGETIVALIKLLNEYGIYGLKCYELIQRMSGIFAIMNAVEGGEEDV